MKKHVSALYDPETRKLEMIEPLEGITQPSEVTVELAPQRRGATVKHWREFAGALKGEAGDELAALVEEMFPTEK